jgi:hypothetical protein
MVSLKAQLDEAERRESSQGRSSPHAVTASSFLASALLIEEQQYVPSHAMFVQMTNHLY